MYLGYDKNVNIVKVLYRLSFKGQRAHIDIEKMKEEIIKIANIYYEYVEIKVNNDYGLLVLDLGLPYYLNGKEIKNNIRIGLEDYLNTNPQIKNYDYLEGGKYVG